jgi:hypothetical protein
MSAERRQSPRFPVSMAATVIVPGGKPVACQIIDIGAAGCRIRLPEGTRLWGPVTLKNQGQTLAAQVVWAKDGVAGLWFPNVKDDGPEPGMLRRLWNQLRGGAG